MKFELVNKRTNEVIDTTFLTSNIGISGARTYFKSVKQLDDENFDELFVVKIKKIPRPNKQIEWWWDEPNTMDEF